MRTTRASVAIALTLALAFAACSDDPDPTPADTDTREADTSGDTVEADTAPPGCEHECRNAFGVNDRNMCPEPRADWLCVNGCCAPVFRCQADADCAERGYSEGHCADERFDCRCDTGTRRCFAWYCGGDNDCEAGSICAGGACVPEPTPTGFDVRVLSRPTVLTSGARLQLAVDLVDPDDPDVAVAAGEGLDFTSSDPDVMTVTSGGLVTGRDTAGTATITATRPGGAAATITLRNVVPGPADTLTVIVADELSLAPVRGHWALVAGDGAAITGAIPEDGVIRHDGDLGPGGVDLHVFADEHDWVSWLGLDGDPPTLYLPVARTIHSRVEMSMEGEILPAETELVNVGIVEGAPDMTDYERLGAFEIGLTSFGLSTALFDFNLKVLLGADVKRFLHPQHNVPQVDASEPITAPGGVIFNLAGPALPSFVLTAPGGSHRMWSLAGRLDLTEVAEFASEIIGGVTGGEIDFTRIVGAVFPLFRDFWSGYLPGVEVDGVEDAAAVTPAAPRLRMPLGLRSLVDVPPLPPIADLGWADAVFFLGGALTVDGFMIPLGLNGGADTSDPVANPPDGIADGNERTPEKEPFLLPIAPHHSGIQSPHTRYAVVVVAVAIKGRNDPRPESGSGIIVRSEPGDGPPASPELDDFLGFPLASTWEPTGRAAVIEPLPGADVQRLLFKGRRGEHWTVWLNGQAEIALPLPSELVAELGDRAVDDVELLLVNSLDLAEGVTLRDAMMPGGVTLDTLLGHVDRLSFVDIRTARPEPRD